jgi:2-C-methyl-D-erythritol 4-phosphate cytidylyltransferase/2-C-methyl-D-erythritol 2,4-cyclodiphosphate synthase
MSERIVAVLVAAGRGERAGGGLPKQYRLLAGKAVLAHAARPFLDHPAILAVQPVILPDHADLFAATTEGLRLRPPAHGAASRQGSVRAGLEAIADLAPDLVLIHDAARPFVTPALIDRVIAGARAGAAIPGTLVTDTVKQIDPAGRVVSTPDRATLRAVQTPQGFSYPNLIAAHRAAARQRLDHFTDDAQLIEWAGKPVTIVEGDPMNVKLTVADDFRRAQERLAPPLQTRVATGFDVHAFEPGDQVVLGGVAIPHNARLSGHSDADVVLHALTDAVLGTIGDGDIGQHFPPSDQRWRGAASDRFLAFAVERLTARGGRLVSLDVTVLAEAPKIGPHRAAIQGRIAAIAGIAPDRVGLKATTMEQLGFIGRREGIAAMATCTALVPEENA